MDTKERAFRWLFAFLILGPLLFFDKTSAADRAAAVKTMRSIVYHGKLVAPDGRAVSGDFVVDLSIYSPDPNLCLLWSEKQNATVTNGGFALEIGYDTNRLSGAAGGIAQSLAQVFVNNPSLALPNASCAIGSTYSPTATDDRLLKAVFTGGGTSIEVTGLPIKAVPYALQAEEIGGYGLSNLMKISGAGSNVVITPEETESLKTLLGGNLLWDMKSRRITKLADPVAADDAATKSWVLSQVSSGGVADGSVSTSKLADDAVTFDKVQNIASGKLLGRSSAGPGSMEEITIGAGLALTAGTLSATGGGGGGTLSEVTSANAFLTVANGTTSPQLTVNVGTAANTVAAGNDSRITGALQRSGGTMTGAIDLGGFDLNNAGHVNLSSDKHLKLGSFASDPTTTAWGAAEKGRTWFNTTGNQIKYWDGSAVQILGVSGSGLTSLNGMSGSTQTFATGTTGTDFGISSTGNIHTFNLPTSSAANRGLLSAADWISFNSKQAALGFAPVSNALPDGQVFVGNGSNVAAARFFGISDLKTVIGTAQIPASCTASQTLTWSAITDVFSCTNIGSLNASAISAGTLPIGRGGTGSTDGSITGSGALTFAAGGTDQNLVLTPSGTGNTLLGGNVGIGTTSPGAKLEVAGQIKISGGSPGAGKVLQSDANGLATWAVLGGSESTSISNIGTAGVGVYKQMTGAAIELKKINAGSAAITITDDTGNNELDINLGTVPRASVATGTADHVLINNGSGNLSSEANLAVSRGGTGAGTLTANRLLLGNGTSAVQVAAAGTAGQMLQSAGASAPAWSTATFPATTTINQILYSSAANTVAGLATANTGALVTSSTGVPSFASGSTANRVLRTDGTTVSFSQVALTTDVTGTLPVANGGTGAATLTGYVKGSGTSAFTASATIPAADVSGNISGDAANVTGTVAIANGGTGAVTKAAAFDALSPLTTLGDTIYFNGTDGVRLAGNITAAKQFLSQTGTGAVSAAPVWSAISASDITNAIVNGGNTGAITVGTNDATNLSFEANNAVAMTVENGGKVGIGTTTPSVKLDVDGAVRGGYVDAGSGTTLDWSLGNTITTTAGCSGTAFTMNNLVNGASYTLILKASSHSAACSFTGSGVVTWRQRPYPSKPSGYVVITILKAGNDAFVSWSDSF